MAQIFNRLGQLGVGLAVAGGVVQSALFNVDGGHRAVIFDRFAGIKQTVIGEGTHFMIPWVQRPIMFDIRWGTELYDSVVLASLTVNAKK